MKVNAIRCASIVIAALVTPAVRLPAAVKVYTTEPIEMVVAFRVAANKYIQTGPSNSLELAVGKVGFKQTFTIIDLTSGNLQDGDEVRVRYTPHSGKSSYWLESSVGVKRGHDGDVFKLKRVDTKFAVVTPTGRFVAPPTREHALGVSAKQDGALLVEIIDVKSKASVIQPPEKSAATSTALTSAAPDAPSTPQKTEPTPPALIPTLAPDKPDTQ